MMMMTMINALSALNNERLNVGNAVWCDVNKNRLGWRKVRRLQGQLTLSAIVTVSESKAMLSNKRLFSFRQNRVKRAAAGRHQWLWELAWRTSRDWTWRRTAGEHWAGEWRQTATDTSETGFWLLWDGANARLQRPINPASRNHRRR